MRFIVYGSSMEPTFSPNDQLFVSKLYFRFFRPKIGDIVVLKDPRDERLLLKRIKKIAKGGYFVAGDNPKASTDSRHFGMIQKIINRWKSYVSLLPFDKKGLTRDSFCGEIGTL